MEHKIRQAVTCLASDRQFLGMVRRLLPGSFPYLPDQTQFNRRLRRLTPHITTVRLTVAELIAEARCRSSPSKRQFAWGMRLVAICDRKGVPVGYDLVDPKTGQECESACRLATAHSAGSLLFADRVFSGAQHQSG
jgi:hypothetical protein